MFRGANSPASRKKLASSVDAHAGGGGASPVLRKSGSDESALNVVTAGSPKLSRRSSFVKMLRKLGGSDDKAEGAAPPSPSVPVLFKRSSSGSLRIEDRPSSPDSLVSPRPLRDVIKAPPVCSAFEAHLVTNFPVLLVVSQVIVESPALDQDAKIGLFATLAELLKMHEHLIRFISFVANWEAKKCSDSNTLFRETGVLVMLCRALCTSAPACAYVSPLSDRIHEAVGAEGRKLELDPTRCAAWELSATVGRMTSIVDSVLLLISRSLSDCPPLLRIFFQTVFSIVNVRHAGFGFRSLANFYFLRFVIPAMMEPLAVEESKLSAVAKHNIVQVSKTLQSIANGTAPEGGLAAMQPYVEEKAKQMEGFFVNLITARTDDSISELNFLEFQQGDFDRLRESLQAWLLGELQTVRTRLGGALQLHSWLQEDEQVARAMAEMVVLVKGSSGMLSPPRNTWKK